MHRTDRPAPTRRAFLSHAAAALAVPVVGRAGAAAGTPATEGDDTVPLDAVAFLLDAFARFPVVALGEAHGLQEEHDFITALLRHPSFPNTVADIVVEFGNARYQEMVDRYIGGGEDIAIEDLRLAWRDTTQSPGQTWDAPMYPQFFATVRAVNQALPASQRIRVWLGDPPVAWQAVQRREDLLPFLLDRDAHFFAVVEREILAQGRRALLLAGSFHLFKPRHGEAGGTVTARIEQRAPGTTFVVTPHIGFGDRTCELEQRLTAWPAPSIAPTADSWVGALPASVVFGGQGLFVGPDGTPQDPFAGVAVRDLVDAYLYLGPLEALCVAVPPIATYRDEHYFQELDRRHRLVFSVPLDEHEAHSFRYGIPHRDRQLRRLGPTPGPGPA